MTIIDIKVDGDHVANNSKQSDTLQQEFNLNSAFNNVNTENRVLMGSNESKTVSSEFLQNLKVTEKADSNNGLQSLNRSHLNRVQLQSFVTESVGTQELQDTELDIQVIIDNRTATSANSGANFSHLSSNFVSRSSGDQTIPTSRIDTYSTNNSQSFLNNETLDKGLCVLYTNADSLLNKLTELSAIVQIDKPDIIIVTEVLPKKQRKHGTGYM